MSRTSESERHMDILTELKKIIEELLDLEDREMTPETLLIQDLGAESIDLLELAVTINSRFKVAVKDDEIFLTRLRLYSTEAKQQGKDTIKYIAVKYPFLGEERIAEIMAHIEEGPQLKIRDVISYITYRSKGV
ncbi:MAG TPA: phosphopantetheine-binding protein [Syntrophales bacterium]